MHFGRVDSFSGLDLTLPPDQRRTSRFLNIAWGQSGFIRTGAPLWGCPGWVEKVYPLGTKPRDYLFHYSKMYNTIEFNASFYSIPGKAQIEEWLRVVPNEFHFCVKMSQLVSAHLRKRSYDNEILNFLRMLEHLGDHAGLPFIQLPETFSRNYSDDLLILLEKLPKSLNIAFEFRHPSWFTNHMLHDHVINLLYKHGKSTVISDTPGRRDAVHLSLTQPYVMIRFLAYFNSGKDESRIRNWIKKLTLWRQRGIKIYFFVHEPNHNVIPDILSYLNWKLYETDIEVKTVSTTKK